MAAPARQKRPVRFHGLTAAALVLACTLLLWLGVSRKLNGWHLLACWLVAVNAIAFGYYGYDKRRARAGASRVPELVLHGLTAAGGALGSYAAMNFFRHKTVKGKFRILFWCIVALQVTLAAWVVKMTWWG